MVIGADTYPPDVNGAANFAHRLAHGLARRGHEVHVICPSTGPRTVTSYVDGVTEHRLRSHRIRLHPTFRVCLPWQTTGPVTGLLEEIGPDVVHVQSHFPVCRALVGAARTRGTRVVATNHFMPENLLGYARVPDRLAAAVGRLAWRDLVRVYRQAQVVTAPTPRAVQLLHDNGLPVPAHPVSCGIDLRRFGRLGFRAPGDDLRRVLFVGRLDEEKRVHELLHAVALVPRSLPVLAEIVGNGRCRKTLEELTDHLGIRDRVVFHGLVSDADLLVAYARADLFCMPGIAELQSLATMEAMAAGKPVIAADAMALPHLVEPGRTGLLYSPGDIHALAGHLTELLGDPRLSAELGAAARSLVARHDIDHTLSTFEDLYRPLRLAELPRIDAGLASQAGQARLGN
ncbi:glycosyltransferase [Streptomyces sp.]|uniref:glycosyltransferase n=1 Tax=Streptomyces sp. TaxID=1931 RepID=UPI002D775F72|nr:glycosyltransferase [Streptomyces sp.]HET6355860.1 glycosyltransferase [Streptomyces sp.]